MDYEVGSYVIINDRYFEVVISEWEYLRFHGKMATTDYDKVYLSDTSCEGGIFEEPDYRNAYAPYKEWVKPVQIKLMEILYGV